MNRETKWLAYNELAWTEPILAPPDEYAEETELLVRAIEEHSKIEVKTLCEKSVQNTGGENETVV